MNPDHNWQRSHGWGLPPAFRSTSLFRFFSLVICVIFFSLLVLSLKNFLVCSPKGWFGFKPGGPTHQFSPNKQKVCPYSLEAASLRSTDFLSRISVPISVFQPGCQHRFPIRPLRCVRGRSVRTLRSHQQLAVWILLSPDR